MTSANMFIEKQKYPTWLLALLVAVALHAALFIAKQVNLGEAEGVQSPTFQIALSLMKEAVPQPLSAVAKPQQAVEEVQVEPTPVVKKQKAEKKPEPVKKQQPVQKVMEAQAVAETPKQLNAIAPAAKRVTNASHGVINSYRSTLIELVKSAKRYPEKALDRSQEGVVTIEFTVSKTGDLLASRIVEKSQYRALNKESIKMIKRAAPFPAAPAGFKKSQITIVVPVEFRM